jgi:hypothetical protein
MKIGIIGAESSHTAAIAKIINVEKQVKGFTVDYVWGETDELARKAAKEGSIPNIAKKQQDMLGKIDAIIVDHRHAKYHLKAALPFIKAGLPVFVDKPFCYRVSEGINFLKMAQQNKAPVTSFSILPEQTSFKRFLRKIPSANDILTATIYGPCDVRSKYGGIFFYGIHHIQLAVKAFGYNITKVQIVSGKNVTIGHLLYSDGKVVTIHFIKNRYSSFEICAVGRSEERRVGKEC